MRIVLVSTYDLGRQPFGLASPAAILGADGHDVACVDLAVGSAHAEALASADLIAFHLPMHTATRLAAPLIQKVRQRNPEAWLCCYGLYAPLNEELLLGLGVRTLVGGEFEEGLRRLARRLAHGDRDIAPGALVSLERIGFLPPERKSLPPLDHYAKLRVDGVRKTVGYTEASRGCKHQCRHCPVVPVYQGHFRIVPLDVVLADVRAQAAAGARHITFGDPDFFNGPKHAVQLVERFHREFPELTYDATIKIEHLRRHRDLLPLLRETGCLFVTSAVESIDDDTLRKLDKGHTRADFIKVVESFRDAALDLAPTFIPFTPWTTRESYRELLRLIAELGLIENVAPVQLALRLLITSGSRLLELEEIRALVKGFDETALVYRWKHPDPAVDALAARLLKLVAEEQRTGSRRTTFARIWETAFAKPFPDDRDRVARAAIPYLEEPWYC